MSHTATREESELGKKTEYDHPYDPEILFAIPRLEKRNEMGISHPLPFFGFDLWNHYEVSWLNQKGKPEVALSEISYNCESKFIIESKSMKLYFNSLNHTHFENAEAVRNTVRNDLEKKIGRGVSVNIIPLTLSQNHHAIHDFSGTCLDDLDIECATYLVDPNFLTTNTEVIEETVYSHLLKSNCLVTKQPDWGSIQISYKGKEINKEGLLRYLISFRNHNEFHEQCIERIFMDIMKQCQPEELTIYGRYTRRGGLDINPYRSTKNILDHDKNLRLVRQ